MAHAPTFAQWVVLKIASHIARHLVDLALRTRRRSRSTDRLVEVYSIAGEVVFVPQRELSPGQRLQSVVFKRWTSAIRSLASLVPSQDMLFPSARQLRPVPIRIEVRTQRNQR